MAEADPNISLQDNRPFSLDDAHILRSRFLDATALLESKLAALMEAGELDPKLGAALGIRLMDLGKSKIAPKKEVQRELLDLADIRAKVVHSQVQIVRDVDSSETHLWFSTVPVETHNGAMLSLCAFEKLETRVRQLAHHLKQLSENVAKQPTPAAHAATNAKS